MLQITINVNTPAANAQMIKESLAMFLERWGDCRVVQVKEFQAKEYPRQEPQPQQYPQHQQQRFC